MRPGSRPGRGAGPGASAPAERPARPPSASSWRGFGSRRGPRQAPAATTSASSGPIARFLGRTRVLWSTPEACWPRRDAASLLGGPDSRVELRQPPLEQAPLGLVVDERQRAAVGVAGLLGSTEAAQQLAPPR